MTFRFESLVERFRAIDLEGMDNLASLDQRFDRKYVVSEDEASSLFAMVPGSLAALEIAGRRAFAYESWYFDTADLESFRATAHRRRRRWKVRTRTYLDAQKSMVEVKLRDQRGQSVKRRLPEDFSLAPNLTIKGARFVNEILKRDGFAATLTSTLQTSYERVSVVDVESGVRLTADLGVRCRAVVGKEALIEGVVIETKSPRGPGPIDRALWRRGHRPVRLSKYATGMAAIHHELPRNKWHQTIDRHFSY
ncbi:MAG TPA: VTC domain-containing protein [Acidimicrobiia bacterium]|nr:VTC domain-containing protein [Acidimicrobiia bacterium]HIL06315.1 VTC domain-containing protein [Acidimicrobiia bacterium]